MNRRVFLLTFLLVPCTQTMAASYSYDISSADYGPSLPNATITTGTFEIADHAFLGKSIRATSATHESTDTAGVTLTALASSSDYSVTWKKGYTNYTNGGRDGFTLRTQDDNAVFTGITATGIKTGYFFQVNDSGAAVGSNSVRIYRFSTSGLVLLKSVALTSAQPRWYRAVARGTLLSLYYSDDGTNYLLVASTTDSVYRSGYVQYSAGYSNGPIGDTYINSISQETYTTVVGSGPVISSISTSSVSDAASVQINWQTDTVSDSQIEYGTSTSYSSTTANFSNSTLHSVRLTGLVPGSTYHFRVGSTDASSNSATSSDQTLYLPPSPGTIAITAPRGFQTFQRRVNNTSDIPISGTYTGSPSTIEASWNGRPYITIDSHPSGGTFSAVLGDIQAGQGNLNVRFSSNTAVVAATTSVGVGDIYVIAGQSNASGRGTSNQTYTSPADFSTLRATLFGNDDSWKNLTDPTDSSSGQVDSISTDSIAAGSVWPVIATRFLADQRVPISFIPTSKGGTSITEWQRSLSTTTLYGSMYRRINASGGRIKGVVFFQGETDASNSMSRDAYLSYLYGFTNSVYNDFGVKTFVGEIGNQTLSASQIDNIRRAQIESWENGTTTFVGPTASDINLADESGDNLHFKSNGDLLKWGNRWWAAIQRAYYSGADGQGPRLLYAEENSARDAITFVFNDESFPIISTSSFAGFEVKDDGLLVVTTSTSTAGYNAIKIGFSAPLSGSSTVSFGSGGIASGRNVPTDSSTYNLPLDIFIDHNVLYATPPLILAHSPNGNTEPDNGNVILSITTDQNAQCRYSTNSNASFYNMQDVFSTTGTTTSRVIHSTTLTNVLPGRSYLYYINCIDEVGNAMTSNASLAFVTNNSIALSKQASQGSNYQVTSTSPIIFSRNLSIGDTGQDVKDLQNLLVSFGLLQPGNTTGYFGKLTRQAVINLQKNNSVFPSTGNFGPLIRQLLNSKANVPIPSKGTYIPGKYRFDNDLGIGNSHIDVKNLQIFLNKQGYIIALSGSGSSGQETEYFGIMTYNALKKFQTDSNISPVSGFFGPKTRNKINSLSVSL